RQGPYRFKHSTDLCRGGNVAVLSNLCAAADKRVRVDHSAIAYPRTGVDIHRRHARDTLADEAPIADARAARHNADAAGNREPLHRPGSFVEKWLPSRVHGHVDDPADAESQ